MSLPSSHDDKGREGETLEARLFEGLSFSQLHLLNPPDQEVGMLKIPSL